VARLRTGDCVWDSVVKGFGVRRQRESAVYVLKYRYQGRQRFLTIGPNGSPWTPESARSEAKRLLGIAVSIEHPRDPAAEREHSRGLPTFAEFAKRYLAEYAQPRKKPRSVAEDRRNLKLHIVPAFGSIRISDLSGPVIARFHAARRAHPANANRCLALVSHIMTVAEKWGVRPSQSNPCRGIDRYHEVGRERMLSPVEIQKLGDALKLASEGMKANAHHHDKLRSNGRTLRRSPEDWRAIACIRLLLVTGARLGEILSLKWEYLDRERRIARLPDSKTGRRNLSVTTPAWNILHELPRDPSSPFVLPGKRPDSHFIGIQKPWQRIRALAGLSDLRLHDLRHAFASEAVAGGSSLFVVGAVLGHRQAMTTQRYAHLVPDHVGGVADQTATRIATMLGWSGTH
jgi:integrase